MKEFSATFPTIIALDNYRRRTYSFHMKSNDLLYYRFRPSLRWIGTMRVHGIHSIQWSSWTARAVEIYFDFLSHLWSFSIIKYLSPLFYLFNVRSDSNWEARTVEPGSDKNALSLLLFAEGKLLIICMYTVECAITEKLINWRSFLRYLGALVANYSVTRVVLGVKSWYW